VAKATKMDYLTPMEPLFATEVAYAALHLNRAEANDIVNRLLDRYEKRIPDPPAGKMLTECYDINSLTPSAEYVDLVGKVKEELRGYGLPIN